MLGTDNKCSPGRFFASQQLKLLLAIISLKYDIKPISYRPANRWLNNTVGPDIGITLEVRRRLETSVETTDINHFRSEETAEQTSLSTHGLGGVHRTASNKFRNFCSYSKRYIVKPPWR